MLFTPMTGEQSNPIVTVWPSKWMPNKFSFEVTDSSCSHPNEYFFP